jgi:DNA-binding HxlR family transcriptional regulator
MPSDLADDTLPQVREFSLDPANCPVRQVLDGLGDKWSILVMAALHQSGRRFSELRRDIPDVSQKMLTHTLRKLERDGLIERIVTPTAPPRVDYRLRPLGQNLFVRFASLAAWVIDNRREIDIARASFDARSG